MKAIKYTLTEVKPFIYAVVIKDDYDRAMTFCRVQEYYESPNDKFRGKDFSIWDFMKWYSNERGIFSYAQDWAGFNIPLPVAMNCYNMNMIDPLYETPYDKVMHEIIRKVWHDILKKENTSNGYIIGAENLTGKTFEHEVCHGLYSVNEDYRERVDKITSAIPVEHRIQFEYNLMDMGYTESVIDDEIQAYLSTNWQNDRFGKGIEKKDLKKYHAQYVEIFKTF